MLKDISVKTDGLDVLTRSVISQVLTESHVSGSGLVPKP